ncbi:hypothetical protein IH979_00595 [Patescibacteria group bacterium]|nr:hypothetical protein [Patescibacteria group bacterium]
MEQKQVILYGAVILGVTVLLLLGFLVIKRAPETELGDFEFFESTSEEIGQEDQKRRDQLLVTAGKYGQPGKKNLWKTSGDFFTLEIPHEWEINQRDAAGSSAIIFFDPEEPDNRGIVFLQSGSYFATGERFEFDAWVLAEVADLRDSEECAENRVGGVEMICYTGQIDNEEHLYFFAKLNEELYVRVSKPIEEFRGTSPLWGAINSIDFDPSEKDLDEALIIP